MRIEEMNKITLVKTQLAKGIYFTPIALIIFFLVYEIFEFNNFFINWALVFIFSYPLFMLTEKAFDDVDNKGRLVRYDDCLNL